MPSPDHNPSGTPMPPESTNFLPHPNSEAAKAIVALLYKHAHGDYESSAKMLADAIAAGKVPGIALKTYDGTTCWHCEKCGKVRTGRGCMTCLEEERCAAVVELGALNDSLGVIDSCQIKPLVDDLRAQLATAINDRDTLSAKLKLHAGDTLSLQNEIDNLTGRLGEEEARANVAVAERDEARKYLVGIRGLSAATCELAGINYAEHQDESVAVIGRMLAASLSRCAEMEKALREAGARLAFWANDASKNGLGIRDTIGAIARIDALLTTSPNKDQPQ